MLDLSTRISTLLRPRLLVSAARFGVDDYRREAHLPRLIGGGSAPRVGEAILRLLEAEAEIEEGRAAGLAGYSPARHVAVLVALLGEARHLAALRASDAIN